MVPWTMLDPWLVCLSMLRFSESLRHLPTYKTCRIPHTDFYSFDKQGRLGSLLQRNPWLWYRYIHRLQITPVQLHMGD